MRKQFPAFPGFSIDRKALQRRMAVSCFAGIPGRVYFDLTIHNTHPQSPGTFETEWVYERQASKIWH